MKKIIVRIQDDNITPIRALTLVSNVIKMGRLSNYGKNYCYVVKSHNNELVYANRNSDTSDTFTVWIEPNGGT